MEIKTQQPVRVMFNSLRTSLKNLHKDVEGLPEALYNEAMGAQTQVAGPQHWVYLVADKNPETEFTLEMTIPITGEPVNSKYQVKELPEFKCVSMIHEGAWDKIGDTYKTLIGEAMAKGLMPTDQCREVYQTVDMEQPQNNITEVQVGIQ